MAIENRYIRIEDWKGNVYFPIADSKATTAGSILDSSSASSDPESPIYSDGEKVTDAAANGATALFLKSKTDKKVLFSSILSNIEFGKIAVGVRIKSSISTGSTPLFEINAYYVDGAEAGSPMTLLHTYTITASDIGIANEFVTIGTTFDYKGTATGLEMLKLELNLLPDTGCSAYFDQMLIAMSMAGYNNSKIKVEGTTIIVP